MTNPQGKKKISHKEKKLTKKILRERERENESECQCFFLCFPKQNSRFKQKKKKKKKKKEASWLTTTMENFYLVKSIQYYSFFISFLLGSKSLEQLTNHEHKFV